MSASHTPGPWRIVYEDNLIRAEDKNRTIICKLGNTFNEQVIADAKLIAAAPELLESLRDLILAASAEFNEKGAGGYALARLTDARWAVNKALGNNPGTRLVRNEITTETHVDKATAWDKICEKGTEMAQLRKKVSELEMILTNHRLQGCHINGTDQ